MVPDKNRKEWKEMISGKYDTQLTSLSLKLKLNSLKLDCFKLQKKDVESASNDLHSFCVANETLCIKDINNIFK